MYCRQQVQANMWLCLRRLQDVCMISVQTGSSWAVTGASDSCSTRSPSAAPVLWPFPWCLKGEFAPCGWLGSRKASGYYNATGISKSVWDKSDLKDCQQICRVILYLSVNKQVSLLSCSQAVSLSKMPPGPNLKMLPSRWITVHLVNPLYYWVDHFHFIAHGNLWNAFFTRKILREKNLFF